MRLATFLFETKLKKCIRMGITIFKFFIWEGISSDIPFGNHVLRLRSRIAVKLNFRPYIRRYTSPNEKFEYSYPLIKTGKAKENSRTSIKLTFLLFSITKNEKKLIIYTL